MDRPSPGTDTQNAALTVVMKQRARIKAKEESGSGYSYKSMGENGSG